jgi:hypothetical protein
MRIDKRINGTVSKNVKIRNSRFRNEKNTSHPPSQREKKTLTNFRLYKKFIIPLNISNF